MVLYVINASKFKKRNNSQLSQRLFLGRVEIINPNENARQPSIENGLSTVFDLEELSTLCEPQWKGHLQIIFITRSRRFYLKVKVSVGICLWVVQIFGMIVCCKWGSIYCWRLKIWLIAKLLSAKITHTRKSKNWGFKLKSDTSSVIVCVGVPAF